MPVNQQSCSLCGQAITHTELAGSGQPIVLDTVPTYDAPYRLVGENQEQAERIERPGFYGYTDHAKTCPKRNR